MIEGSGNGGYLMAIGIWYFMAVLIIFIALGAGLFGGLPALTGIAAYMFASFVVAGVSLFFAGLM